MLRRIRTMAVMSAIAAGMISMADCASDAENAALLGTAIGAGVGALAGGSTEGALIGAAIGGGAGYAIGDESDKRKTRQEIASVRAEQIHKNVMCHCYKEVHENLTNLAPGEYAHVDTGALCAIDFKVASVAVIRPTHSVPVLCLFFCIPPCTQINASNSRMSKACARSPAQSFIP